jgi:uncharacterized protein DUF6527
MRKNFRIEYEFLDFIPRELKERTLYISIEFTTATHMCFCGCGGEVVTPISPVGWQLTFDGESVSLSPSIGSWSLRCKSHYWIRRNTVHWAGKMSTKEIAAVTERDDRDRQRYYGVAVSDSAAAPMKTEPVAPSRFDRFWSWAKRLFP